MAVGVGALLFAGCADDEPKGTVTGTLQLIGGPMGGTQELGDGWIEITPSQGSPVQQVEIDQDGHFTASVPPGSYSFVGHSSRYGGGEYPCVGPKGLTVGESETTTVTVNCMM
jgi:hypothetical protein